LYLQCTRGGLSGGSISAFGIDLFGDFTHCLQGTTYPV